MKRLTSIMKNNPGLLSQEDLVRSFVVRNVDFELLVEIVRENRDETNQHVLIMAPRGMGKTMLALRLAAEVRLASDLSALWFPVVFGEESYEITTPGEFWLAALRHLGEQRPEQRLSAAYRELIRESDETRLRERALAQLQEWADREDKRILLVVENLNMILREQLSPDDGWTLRHTLQNEPWIMLLATATSRFEDPGSLQDTGKIDRAMFGLFKSHELDGLDDDECRRFWQALTGDELGASRIRPLQILTGGNPRLLVIIASFAEHSSFFELMRDLTHLIDEHTTYFKSNIESLPSQERKVFITLAEIWEPATASAVARQARIAVNKASSFLNRLVSRGAVQVTKQEGRRKYYQISERLYNIYHLLRCRGGASGRLMAVVEFMVHFYEEDKLASMATSMASEAFSLDVEARRDHFEAYEGVVRSVGNPKFRERILKLIEWVCLNEERDFSAYLPSLVESARKVAARKPDDLTARFYLAYALVAMGDHEEGLALTGKCLVDEAFVRRKQQLFVNLFTRFARAGRTEAAIDVLEPSPASKPLEPLLVALKIHAGVKFNAPQEVEEVAKDVARNFSIEMDREAGKEPD